MKPLAKKFVWFLLPFVFVPTDIAQSNQGVSTSSQSQSASQSQSVNAITIPAGTLVNIELQEPLNSKINERGDEVYAVLLHSLTIDGNIVLRKGTEFHGRITQVTPARRGQQQASMSIIFDQITLPIIGTQKIDTRLKAIDDYANEKKIYANSESNVKGGRSSSRTVDNAIKGSILAGVASPIILATTNSIGVTGSTPLGGAIAGVLLTKGEEIRLNAGTIFRLEITKSIIVPTNLDNVSNPNSPTINNNEPKDHN